MQSSIFWLAVDDKKQEVERSRRSIMKHFGTFEWVGQVLEMKSWLKDDDLEPILWLNGKPEAGMSHLLNVLISF